MQRSEELFQRYIWLVNTLLSSGDGITFEAIQSKWNRAPMYDNVPLARSTFNRYRSSIEAIFGIRIECDKHRGAVYYIDDPDSLKTNSIQSWMLRTLTVGNVLQNGLELHGRILLEDMPMGQEHLQTIINAMTNGHSLHFEYNKSYQVVTRIEVEPYCLKVFRQRWYLLGHNTRYAANDLRIYALDRISCLEESERTFRMPEGFNAGEYFMDDFGVYTGGEAKTETIIIRAYGRLPDYLRSLPLHPSQQEVFSAPGYTEFHYRLRPTYDFRQELLSQAEELEVVSPPAFRDEIARTLKQALVRHQQTQGDEK